MYSTAGGLKIDVNHRREYGILMDQQNRVMFQGVHALLVEKRVFFFVVVAGGEEKKHPFVMIICMETSQLLSRICLKTSPNAQQTT